MPGLVYSRGRGGGGSQQCEVLFGQKTHQSLIDYSIHPAWDPNFSSTNVKSNDPTLVMSC